jgi:hypothetical protein
LPIVTPINTRTTANNNDATINGIMIVGGTMFDGNTTTTNNNDAATTDIMIVDPTSTNNNDAKTRTIKFDGDTTPTLLSTP